MTSLSHSRHAAVPTPPAPAQSVPPFSSAFVRSGARWGEEDRASLVADIRDSLATGDYPPETGIVLVDARTGDTLYSFNANDPLVPASTIKLVVTATALRDLGARYRFKTSVATSGSVQDGVLNGDVYLIGGGDPELASTDLLAAAKQLKASGIDQINGDVVADGSLFGDDDVNKTWDADDLIYGWAAPPSAVTIDDGAVQFTITPDANGGLATVDVDPPTGAGNVLGGVRTASEDGDNTLRIDPLPDGSGFSLSGQIPYGAPQKYWRAIAHPTQAAARIFDAILNKEGVVVSGVADDGAAPAGATTVWTHDSRPLTAIIHRMAMESNNHIAEQLLRSVGAQT
ncbi:MAG TPA: D-alanyl-D-alanine carboxypeptidase/D-alanyl-D-alanine-endopeptidase, partial [Candidatus Eremiobacteraceae bacterium]|nr:D-alanyl-D-alanine carboxypeptidase/D-alanyl-D-alanine-endopeptidase [Candidatus Eremiobacteraceae bacterium]